MSVPLAKTSDKLLLIWRIFPVDQRAGYRLHHLPYVGALRFDAVRYSLNGGADRPRTLDHVPITVNIVFRQPGVDQHLAIVQRRSVEILRISREKEIRRKENRKVGTNYVSGRLKKQSYKIRRR